MTHFQSCVMEACQNTLARAGEAKSKQGTYELEFSFGGEADLLKQFKSCTKNSGHKRFIPINKLEYHHLPEVIRSFETLDWIKYIAQLTVKLTVNYISPHRKHPLPLSDYAGQNISTFGCGSMCNIYLTESRRDLPCPFDNCPDLSEQHQVYGYIVITTAAHVVFDEDEAKNTTVEFFYDNCEDRSNVRTARGVKVGTVSVEGDFCELLCVTHDKDLLSMLEQMISGTGLFMSKFKMDVGTYYLMKSRNILEIFGRFPCLKAIFTKCEYYDFYIDIFMNFDGNWAELIALLVKCDIEELLFNSYDFSLSRMPINPLINLKFYGSPYIRLMYEVWYYARHGKNSEEIIEDTSFYNAMQVGNAILIQELDELIREDLIHSDSIFTRINRIIHRRSEVITIFEHAGDADIMLRVSLQKINQCKWASCENLSSISEENDISDRKTRSDKYKLSLQREKDQRTHENVMIHISHPHGQSKHITFGTHIDCFTGDGHYTHLYTVPTCPGSSGGPVWVIPETKKLKESYGVPHGGSYDKQLNHGCSWTIYPPGRGGLTC